MTRYAFWILAAVVVPLSLCGCVSTQEPISSSDPGRVAMVSAIMLATNPELEREFDDRTTYDLGMLQIMDAANKLGPEGRDMSTLLDMEMVRQFRARRNLTLRELNQELYSLDEQALEAAFHELSVPTTHYPRPWALRYSRALSRAWMVAQCKAIRRIPFVWAAQYPDRRLYSYKHFGITRDQRRRLC